jgi:hypothetical protein
MYHISGMDDSGYTVLGQCQLPCTHAREFSSQPSQWRLQASAPWSYTPDAKRERVSCSEGLLPRGCGLVN